MSNMFNFAGVSTLNGVIKPRFANDMLRVKTLEKNGHTAINLVQLPNAMTKLEAVEYLIEIGFPGEDAATQAAFTSARDKLLPKPAKAIKAVAVEEELEA